MTVESNKWVEVVAKLIKLTQMGALKWRIAIEDFSVGDIENADTAFTAQYKNKILRILRFRYKVEGPGPLAIPALTVFGAQKKYPYWSSAVILEFVDSQGRNLWRFPDTNALQDLYSSVQYQVAGVSDFLEDILKDE